jgi:ABC-type branched-subunit amino acid transport system substrate-binding protein
VLKKKKGEKIMKAKLTTGIVCTLILVSTLFAVMPAKSQITVTLGVIGPVGLPHWSPGMKEAAEMARDEINAGPLDVTIVLKFGDEHAYPTPDPDEAALEVERLITVEGCEIIFGGFRTEVVSSMVEMAAAYDIPFFICGASTNELISEPAGDYVYRTTPVNGTILLYTMAGYIAPYLLPFKLLPLYGQYLWPEAPVPQVKVAVLMEGLEWTNNIYMYMTNPAVYPAVLGPYANVTYHDKIPDGTTDCTSWIQNVIDSEARLLIHVFSGTTGVPLIKKWREMECDALPLGINVMGQVDTYWTEDTLGDCKYEAFLAYTGTRDPIVPGKSEVFWDAFYAKTGHWPLYTTAIYDGIKSLAEDVDATGSKDKDVLKAYVEDPSYEKIVNTGKFKYTSTTTQHDIFSNEYGYVWTQGYVRSAIVQWVKSPTQYAGLNTISPLNMPYSRRYQLPEWMYPISSDLNFDGIVDIYDAITISGVFGSGPEADPPDMAKWLTNLGAGLVKGLESDIKVDGVIDIYDAIILAGQFGTEIALPMP